MASPQIEDGYTKIANELLEAFCALQLSGHEWSLVHCVIRKTYGYTKIHDWIAGSQLSKMTGLPKQRVHEAKKKLIEKKILLINGRKISLNKDYEEWIESNGKTLLGNGKALPKVTENRTHKRKKENIQNKSAETSSASLKDNQKDMGWNKESEDSYMDVEVDYDGDGSSSEKKKGNETDRGFTATEVVEFWNQYQTFADLKRIKKLKGIAKNPTTNALLLPKCKPTSDVLYAIGVCAKRYELEDFEKGIENYIREVINRAPNDSWAGKRYSLYDLVKNKGYLLKTYVNR